MSESSTLKMIKKTKAIPSIEDLIQGEVLSAQAEKILASSKTKKITKTKEEELDYIIKIAQHVENISAEEAIPYAHELLENAEGNYFELGGVLAAINTNGWWEGFGFESFRQFIEAEYGLHYRKAVYLISIYTSLVESSVPWDSIKHLGWTKIKEIAQYVTLDNLEEWVTRAESMTTIQLQEYIKQMVTTTTEGEPQSTDAATLTTVTFKVHSDQKETIKAAVEKAKAEYGTQFDAVALEHVCLSYLEGSIGSKKTVATGITPELLHTLGVEIVANMFEAAWPGATINIDLPDIE
jgi:hypothetical protein